MRLFAHHDADGKIRSLTWLDAPEGISVMLTPGPGELVAEIEFAGWTEGGQPFSQVGADHIRRVGYPIHVALRRQGAELTGEHPARETLSG